jgi:hypothetical protein
VETESEGKVSTQSDIVPVDIKESTFMGIQYQKTGFGKFIKGHIYRVP